MGFKIFWRYPPKEVMILVRHGENTAVGLQVPRMIDIMVREEDAAKESEFQA